MKPVLWGRASSVNVQKVMWALSEVGLEYRRIDAGGKYGRTDTAEFFGMNPLGKVPVWEEEGLTLWESHAILRHLGRGPAAALWPDRVDGMAMTDQWMEFVTSTFQPPFLGVFFQKVRLPLAKRTEAALQRSLAQLDAALDVVELRLSESEWLAGDAFGLADVAAGAPMYRYFDMEIPRPSRPAVERWYGALSGRQAYRETVMTSYEELRAG